MNMQLMTNVLGLLFTSGVIGVVLNFLSQRRKDRAMEPITKESAALAAADAALNITRGTIDRLDERIRAMEEKGALSEQKIDNMERRISLVLLPYIERLRQHIIDGSPPPPPDYPEGWNN